MARLAALLLERFPHFETVWRLREFDYAAKPMSATTAAQSPYGAMGMKPAISASGYNLATAVQRDNKRVIVVVLGSDSPQSRDRRVRIGRAQPAARASQS